MNIGVFFLITFSIIELIFAVYCIASKENQTNMKSIITWFNLGLFLICLSLAIVKWSFRWYAFLLFLAIQAIIGAVFFKKKIVKRAYSTAHILRNFIVSLVICALCLSPALLFPQHSIIQTTGEYKVDTKNFTYIDKNRIETYSKDSANRKLNVEFWFPETSGSDNKTFPLVVFSHGAMGIKSSNLSLYEELASNGYVVCSIDHTYQCLYTKAADGKITLLSMNFAKELMNEDASKNIQSSYDLYKKWMGIVTGDIDFVIDTILKNTADISSGDTVYHLIDISKIGVMGHSLGGSAALGIGRSRKDIKAAIALESPYMCDILGVKDNKFIWNDHTYPIPVLNIYSDSSWNHLREWPQYAQNANFLLTPQDNVYSVYMQGANHFTLTDLSLASPFLSYILSGKKQTIDTEYCLKTINEICLNFFNAFLKDTTEFSVKSVYSDEK